MIRWICNVHLSGRKTEEDTKGNGESGHQNVQKMNVDHWREMFGKTSCKQSSQAMQPTLSSTSTLSEYDDDDDDDDNLHSV